MFRGVITCSRVNSQVAWRRFLASESGKVLTMGGKVQDAIEEKLTSALEPAHLQVLNESNMHNVPKGSETHFKVVVVSDLFDGMSPIQRHRKVNDILADELAQGVHALSIVAKTPTQWAKNAEMKDNKVVRLSKNQRRRLKKKRKKEDEAAQHQQNGVKRTKTEQPNTNGSTTVQYVAEKVDENTLQGIEELKAAFAKFATAEELLMPVQTAKEVKAAESRGPVPEKKDALDFDNDDDADAPEEEEEKRLGRNKRKKLERFAIAELKQVVKRPDLVEVNDISSPDPLLLLHLKGQRNVVPVPRHWSQHGKFLQRKRGKERVSYQLPDFIADTGINKIRAALAEQEAAAKAKQKARQRVMPKMGKMDIDYQVLYDAFFKYQTKPKMKQHGEIYYEGQEYETKTKRYIPGVLSETLREALGMTKEGGPPPWLLNMQRYGPPPSYPNLKFPGVNAPIPEGEVYGRHPGGWGKAPLDQFGRPLYGDVFGVEQLKVGSGKTFENTVDKTTRWGEILEEEEEEEEEDEESEKEENGEENDNDEKVQEEEKRNLDDERHVMKQDNNVKRDNSTEEDESDKTLYKVLEQRKTDVGSNMFGGTYKYVLDDEKTEEETEKQQEQPQLTEQDGDDDEEEDLEANFKF